MVVTSPFSNEIQMSYTRNFSPPLNSAFTPEIRCSWVDITNEFFESIKEIGLGELVLAERLALYDAMSAIEMMDPKMDAGMLCNRGNRPPLTLAYAIENNVLKIEDVPPADTIAIIDTTWSCIVSWLDGHSLVQTVFTNLYLQNPHAVVDPPLKAFCIAVYKIIDLIKDFVSRGLVFEDEDFQPTAYGYKLNPDVTNVRAVGMLKEVEDELNRKRRLAQLDQETDQVVACLNHRIRFTRLLLQAFIGLSKEDVNASTVQESSRLLSGCSEIIPFIVSSVGKASPPAYTSDIHGPVTIGFDPLVNQRLLPPTFPRYTQIKAPAEAYRKLDQLLARLRQIGKIVSYTSFNAALELMLEVSKMKPCIVTRSIMQVLYLPQAKRAGDAIHCVDIIKDAARAFISPPVLMPRSQLLNNPQVKDFLDCFLVHCVRPFSHLIQLCGHNRARQRDKLAHLLEDFANLQDEAERVDAYLHNLSKKSEGMRPHLACFGTWVLYHTLRVMIMFLLSGFELELYSTHEYHYIFWYLYEFLYGWLVSSLSRADAFLSEQEMLNEQNKSKRRNKPKTKRKVRPYAKEITINQGLQSMCGGYYKAMVGFRKDGKLVLPHAEFDSEKVRYEHRFSPFINVLLTPPPVHYNEFKEMTGRLEAMDSQSLYLSAYKHFQQARTFFESIHNPDKEIKELIRISKTNLVVVKLLASQNFGSSSPLDFDFSAHHHFPILKIC